MARMFWPGVDPVGRRMKWGVPSSSGPWMTIVGVVGDVKNGPLNTEVLPQVYEPFVQVPDEEMAETVTGFLRSPNLLARTSREPTSVLVPLRNQIRDMDPSLPITTVRTMQQVIDGSVAPQRFNAFLLVTFAVVALSLAALGIHGTLAYTVSQRAPEIGIRVALGAPHSTVRRMVLRQGLLLAGVGIAAGLIVSWQLSRVLSNLLFGVSPRDPWTFVIVPLVLGAVALLSTWFPARRAARVNPTVAMRK
jgi:putative ABC transport system permease protein